MKFFLPFLIMILGMLGGQVNKAIRRYGVPFTGFLAAVFNSKDEKKERFKKAGILLLLIAALSIGYGDHSWLKFLKYEWLMRFVYASILGIPFLFFGLWWAWPALVAAFQIRAGSFKIGKYDFLWEDCIRYLTMGILISVLVYK